MSTWSISWGKGGRCLRLTTLPLSCAVVMKSGNLNFLEPCGPLQACNGTAVPYMLYYWDTPPTKLNKRMNGAQIKYYTRFLSLFYIQCYPHLHLPCVVGSAECGIGVRSLGNYLCCSVTPCALRIPMPPAPVTPRLQHSNM